MKPAKTILFALLIILIIINIGVLVKLIIKNNSIQTPEDISKKLIDNVFLLDKEAIERTIQARWGAGRLDATLSELEKHYGIKSEPFDWGLAYGVVSDKSIKTGSEKPKEFYAPYPLLKLPPPKNHPKYYETYVNSGNLGAYIEYELNSRRVNCLGMNEYFEHLDHRMKQLEEHLNK
jgi:hypothetical protein